MKRDLEDRRLAVLVHEVRSPVAALSAIAETLADRASDGPDRAELVQLAIAACRGIERVVVDAVTTSVRHESVDPIALVEEVAGAGRLGGARVETRLADGLRPISGDPVRLRQALDNLVSNALVHSGSDRVVVGASAGAGEIRLFVSDDGVGIPEVDVDRITDVGVRLDSGRPGSGFGLAIVRAIAEAHGGRLIVSSTPGQGATFAIELPSS